jgi:hypothetical protein
LGIILSIGSGLGTAVLSEAMDGTVRSKRDMDLLLPVAPLALLPWIETPAERAARARVRKYSLAGVAATLLVAVLLTHFLYRPLDVLWEVALRRVSG